MTCFQMSSSGSVTSPRACCENGRPIMTDPHTGQTICSCQYGTALLNYSRVQSLPESIYGASAAAYAAGAAQGYVPLGAEGSAFYSPLVCIRLISSYRLKSNNFVRLNFRNIISVFIFGHEGKQKYQNRHLTLFIAMLIAQNIINYRICLLKPKIS